MATNDSILFGIFLTRKNINKNILIDIKSEFIGVLIMNRNKVTTFCILMLCSLCLVSITRMVIAQQGGYILQDYQAIDVPTVDGSWTYSFEWTDAEERQLDGSLNAIFRLKQNP